MPVRSTQKVTKLGFAAILILVFVLVLFSINRLQNDHAHLKEMTQDHAALRQLTVMQNATAERALLLYRMSALKDPFQRDELYIQFIEHAESFIKARVLLLQDKQDTHYINSYKKIIPLLRQANNMHNTVIQLLLNDNIEQADVLLQHELLVTQQKVKQEFSNIVVALQNKMDLSVESASRNNFQAISLIVTLGFVILTLGMLIAFYVLKYTRKFEDTIIDQKRIAEEASEFKSYYLANMSHEIRTPLTAIIGFSDSITNESINPQDRIKAGETIVRNGKHLLALINDILDISKIEAGELKVEKIKTSPLHIIDEVISIISEQATIKKLGFSVNYHFPLPVDFLSDPTRLKQIIINLCSNAIKFTEQGSITIEVNFNEQLKKLVFIVNDTGIGMTQQACEKIFSPFAQAETSTTRKFGGTGLGLAISKQLAEAMDGTLLCSSELDKGSQFTLEFSLSAQNIALVTEHIPESNIITPTNKSPQLEGKILLAEDSIDNQELIKLYIEKTGAELTIVDNGEQAVELGLASNFQLILMDMQMPVMNGIEATEMLRAAGYARAIVGLTANATKSDRDKFINAGADDYIAKPINLDHFYSALEKHLKSSVGKTKETDASEKLKNKMKKLSEKFLIGLPNKLQEISHAYNEQDWTLLDETTHKLKGLGGAFGYPEITTLAKIVNDLTRNQQYSELNIAVENLFEHCNGVLKDNAA